MANKRHKKDDKTGKLTPINRKPDDPMTLEEARGVLDFKGREYHSGFNFPNEGDVDPQHAAQLAAKMAAELAKEVLADFYIYHQAFETVRKHEAGEQAKAMGEDADAKADESVEAKDTVTSLLAGFAKV